MVNEFLDQRLRLLSQHERLRECYEIRLKFCKVGYQQKNEYERNEVEINIIQTSIKIDKLSETISKQKAELKEYMDMYFSELQQKDKESNDGPD